MITQKFLIPDGIEYYTGDEAVLFEKTKSSVLKIFTKNKFEFVTTPIIDSINNLTNLNGSKLRGFTSSLSHNRDLGIRADITPQIVRLDYQSYNNNKSRKYSYMGDIYRETSSSFDRNNPYQVGAEYFGSISDSVDINLIKMCYDIISISKCKKIILDLNDSYFMNKFLNSLNISENNKYDLLGLVSIKSKNEIQNFFKSLKLSMTKYKELTDLMLIDGPIVLAKDINKFSKKYAYNHSKRLKTILNISSKLHNLKNINICIDLCSSKSMDYESGFHYSFYVENLRKPIAVGGRYEAYKYNDNSIRNATGFSIDLKDIVNIHEK